MNKLYSVHDHWTDINKKNDVDIESIDGVITGIKVNGEDYGGGESDFSIAKVTVVNEPTTEIEVPLAVNVDNKKLSATGIYESGVFDVILYGGTCHGAIPDTQGGTVSVSGDIVLAENNDIIITGDGSITISYT